MVLPPGIDKATGAQVALDELGLSFRNVVGIGDAENDHAFLGACELSFAVANALDGLKERCDQVTQGDHGDGVSELAALLIDDDLTDVVASTERLLIPLGVVEGEGSPIAVRPDQNLSRGAVREREVHPHDRVPRDADRPRLSVLPGGSRG